MSEPISIAMYADLACPYAYVSAYRVRKLREEDRETVIILHKSLALEYVNREPTPSATWDSQISPLIQISRAACASSPLPAMDRHAWKSSDGWLLKPGRQEAPRREERPERLGEGTCA